MPGLHTKCTLSNDPQHQQDATTSCTRSIPRILPLNQRPFLTPRQNPRLPRPNHQRRRRNKRRLSGRALPRRPLLVGTHHPPPHAPIVHPLRGDNIRRPRLVAQIRQRGRTGTCYCAMGQWSPWTYHEDQLSGPIASASAAALAYLSNETRTTDIVAAQGVDNRCREIGRAHV